MEKFDRASPADAPLFDAASILSAPESKPPRGDYRVTATADHDSLPKLSLTDNATVKREDAQLEGQIDAAVRERRLHPGFAPVFKEAADKFIARAQKAGLSQEEVAATFNQVERLLTAQNGKLSPGERAVVAMEIISHAAQPERINQGQHKTCNATTLEERLFTRNPSKAAEVIVDTALTGSHKYPDGRTITLDVVSLRPGAEERTFDPTGKNGARTWASQLFQVSVINHHFSHEFPGFSYRQGTPLNGNDTGERILRGGKTYNMEGSPVMSLNAIQREGNILTGSKQRFGVQYNEDVTSRDVTDVTNEHALLAQLQRMKAQGNLPAVMLVDAHDELFDGVRSDDSYGSHVVSVTDVYQKNDGHWYVRMSNQWGAEHDRALVPVGDLFRAMKGRQ